MELLEGKYQAHEKGFGFVQVDGIEKVINKYKKVEWNND